MTATIIPRTGQPGSGLHTRLSGSRENGKRKSPPKVPLVNLISQPQALINLIESRYVTFKSQ